MNVLDDELTSKILPFVDKGAALLLDADRTLTPIDTGREVGNAFGLNDQIRSIFENQGYSDAAFLAAARAWGSIPEHLYVAELERVADSTELYPFWSSLLPELFSSIQVVVVTSGIAQLWKRVMVSAGFQQVTVIGGCRQGTDSYVVSPDSKACLVRCLKHRGMHVAAAGDSIIDLPMLLEADEGFIVPDSKGSPRLFQRIESLDHRLRHLAVDNRSFSLPRVDRIEFLTELKRN